MPPGWSTREKLAAYIAQNGFQIGEHSYGAPRIEWWGEAARLTIGRYCSIAHHVSVFLGGNHNTHWVSTYPFTAFPEDWPEAAGIPGHPSTNGDVVIGNDVWLGQGCTILSGVTVGDGAVVGAGALVSRDVPPYAVVAGNPAQQVRLRFPPATVARLLTLRWWDWPLAQVRRAAPLLASNDLDAFFRMAEAFAPGHVPD